MYDLNFFVIVYLVILILIDYLLSSASKYVNKNKTKNTEWQKKMLLVNNYIIFMKRFPGTSLKIPILI